MLIDSHAKFRKARLLKRTNFIACISYVYNFCARRKAGSEFGNNLFDEFAVRAGSQFDLFTIRNDDRDHPHLAMLCPFAANVS